ncbi:MAG: hypothetical protein K2N73_09235, partial [Lachnospiraceae bacterium]|nr:hypothetical protein [Lachnospiraceae bacterium]
KSLRPSKYKVYSDFFYFQLSKMGLYLLSFICQIFSMKNSMKAVYVTVQTGLRIYCQSREKMYRRSEQ